MSMTTTTPRRRALVRVCLPLLLTSLWAVTLASCTAGGTPPSGGETSDTATDGTTLPTRMASIITPAPGPPVHGGALSIGLGAESQGWNPATTVWGGDGYQVARAIYDPLTAAEADGTVKPYLAKAITPSADLKEWTIELRPGIVFHNGQPVDAAAVKENFEAQRISNLTAAVFRPITDVTVTGPLTVTVKMSKPWSTFPGYLSAQPGFIAAPETLRNPEGSQHPIGSGPFIFDDWSPDAILHVHRNPSYWQSGLPYLDNITFRVLSDSTSRAHSFEAGETDIVGLTQASQITDFHNRALAGDCQFLFGGALEPGKIALALNTAKPPFDDVDARRAVAYGIDNDSMTDTLFGGVFQAVHGPLVDSAKLYAPSDYPRFDEAKARELANKYKATHGVPLSFSLAVPPDPATVALVQAAQQMLATVGIEMKIDQVQQAALITNALTGNFQATGWIGFNYDNIEGSYIFLHKDNVAPNGTMSIAFTRLSDDAMSAALDELRATSDPAAQKAAVATIQKEMGAQVPFVFLAATASASAAGKRVHGMAAMTDPDGGALLPFDGSTLWLHQLWVDRP